jgi:hypothetical protein
MNWTIWEKRYFDIDSNIDWPCPNCYYTSLFLVKEKFYSEETANSKKTYKDYYDDWEPEWAELIFNGQLKCKSCSENIFFTGVGKPQYNRSFNPIYGDYNEEYIDTFTPTFFQPTIKIFKIPDQCGDDLKEEIENSFKLFWCDLQSCANKIRIALELLMNEQKVKKLDNSRKKMSLHKRIEIYQNIEVRDWLLAIKWIGNTGSHLGNIEVIDILETYQLLEFSLNKIYNDHTKKINRIAKGINKSRGTRKRNT